jgi:hypothetical protein
MATKAQTLPRNPERVAWTVLLASFATFVALLGTLTLGGSWWLRNASVNQSVAPVYSGTVLVTRPGAGAPQANPPDIPIESTIVTDANVQASLTFASADGRQELATVQVFGGSQVQIVQANSPRFSTGLQAHRIVLRLGGGRVRAYVGVDLDRPVIIEIHSNPGAVTVLEVPGSNAEVEVSANDSMVTVREGQAMVSGAGRDVVLSKDERTQVLAGVGPGEAIPAERNLISNSDFGEELGVGWVEDIRAPMDPNESAGTVDPVTVGGRRTIRFLRSGVNWGQVGIVQTINRDVQGYASLRLRMDVMVASQDVANCGTQGTECPLIAKVDYVDVFGNPVEWIHGFYFNYNVSLPGTFCLPCTPRQWPHEQWPKGRWQPYESPNLLEIFSTIGNPAATIRSVTLYASGHTFSSFVTDVQLLAE